MSSASGRLLADNGAGHAGVLDARMELLGRISAGLAHDLNGPIGVMLGFAQLAREKIETGDPSAMTGIVEYLKMVESAGENARGLARDMWGFATGVTDQVSEIDFAELLETSVRLVGPTLRVAAIEPPIAGELAAQSVTGDRAMWTQALVGIMIEAPKALPGGGSLTLGLERDGERQILDISFVAAPNEPGVTAAAPSPALEWECSESTMAVVVNLGGTLSPMSGLDGGRSGLELKVPTDAYGT